MLFVALAAPALVLLTVITHYEVLRGISILIPKLRIAPRKRVLFVVLGIFLAHVVAIVLYAIGYFVMVLVGAGTIEGHFNGDFLDFLYFSATSYTTLGVGDLFPQGPARILVGVESLNGFVLIGWSASFTYYSMQKFWDDHKQPHFLLGHSRPTREKSVD